jgi:hypothetical protein
VLATFLQHLNEISLVEIGSDFNRHLVASFGVPKLNRLIFSSFSGFK